MRLNRGYRWLPALGWMMVIFGLSHQTGSDLNSYLPWVQRWLPWLNSFDVGHFVSYFILACLIWWAMASQRLMVSFIVVLICMLYGITDEYHQSFIAGRSPDLIDLRNDTIGALLAMVVVRAPFISNRLFH
ncbi:MAG: VanZ family protein [Paenibacillaceae bacterium]